MNKTTKILIAVLAVAVIIIALLLGYILGTKKKENEDVTEAVKTTEATEAPEKDTEKETEVSTEEDTNEPEEDTTEAEKKNDSTDKKYACYVKLSSGDSWEDGGKPVVQYSADLMNKSKADISGWEIKIDGFTGAEFVSGWNGKFKIKGDTLSITPESYNETVAAKGSTNVGFQIKFKDEAATKKVSKNAVLFVGGKEYTEPMPEKEQPKETPKKEKVETESGTPFDNHGKLSLKGTDIVDKNGKPYQLKGISTHGLAWFPDYVNKEAFKTLRDDWGANIIRLAMYTAESGGYCTDGDQDKLKKLVDDGVTYATELGMYVIIDWHILHDTSPLDNQDEAELFWAEMAQKYADYENVIFEICNEPNGSTTWSDVKEYADTIIPIIRKYDKDVIIVVGTPTWSQDVDLAAKDPVKNSENVMYAIHFYAATHKDNIRSKLETAHGAGLPIFVTEFSICEASGNGEIDYDSADTWFELINKYNLSYCGWNLSNKDEASSLIDSSCKKTSDWKEDELSETGKWLRDTISN
ncbi:MAG: cellulase family glycosylhydrolase [Eubacterium sp.]|nr:cellulase family glycosylhydrolase [Eubacterium sp.]